MDYDIIICFETHVELKTASKLFCKCSAGYGAKPNTNICPVCTGQPGALPVLNRQAVEYCLRTGLALNCRINQGSRFARKNYFYPDLPKGYQISQYELPFCENGLLEVSGDDGKPYTVGIKRIHLEEDAGKLVHSAGSFEAADHSLVDYNRSSVPLLEIVGDHQRNPLRSLGEARTYLDKLRQTLIYIGVSDCIIERGQFRCDVNISLRPRGAQEFGNRTEIKNMASLRFIIDALRYEIKRQAEILRSGGSVEQETRLFDETRRITRPMRSKEDAPDYRYFPDPDLVPVSIEPAWVEEIRAAIPELPAAKVNRLIAAYAIPRNEALVLTKDKSVSDFFEQCAGLCRDSRVLSRWITKDLFKLFNQTGAAMNQCPIKAEDFAQLINLLAREEITDQIARQVLAMMFESGADPSSIIAEHNLRPVDDALVLRELIAEVGRANPEVVAKIRAGLPKPIAFLIGQVMQKTGGKADPKKVKRLIEQQLLLKS